MTTQAGATTEHPSPSTKSSTPRRAAGPHATKPRIGVAMLRTVAGARAAVALIPGATVNSILEEFCAATSFCTSPDLRETLIRTCVTVARSCRVDASNVRADVGRAFDGYEPVQGNDSVDDVAGTLTAELINGEALAWSVVRVESLNHVLLVRKEAHRAARVWDRQAGDLETYAWRGLRLALRNYSPEQWMFSTYACPKIRGSIHDGVRSEHHLPKRLTTFVNKVERERASLSQDLGRHPSMTELADRVGVHLDKLKALPHLATPTSIDERDADHVGHQLVDSLDISELVEHEATADAVRAAIANLEPDVSQAVQLLVLDGCSYAEARRRTGVSQRQLRTRRDRGLRELAGALADWR